MANRAEPEPLALTDPKVVAAALAAGGQLARTDATGNRIVFFVVGIASDFTTQILRDEVRVSVRAYIAAMDAVLGLIAEHKRRRW